MITEPKKVAVTIWLLSLSLLLACSLFSRSDDATGQPEAQETSVAQAVVASLTAQASQEETVAEPVATAVPPTVAAPSTAPSALSAVEIFTQISPAIAFIDTPSGTGSAVLIDNGYLVTNAHVVWPFETVRVVFADGSEFVDTPVYNWDLMADLAVLGPIEVDLPAHKLVDGEGLPIGSDVYLIGYPGEVETFPQPTITRGLISRFRSWDTLDLTYIQTDATIAGGQSGGVLVSDRGEVLGISGFYFTEFGFGLVASAADISTRIADLLAGNNVDQLGERRLRLADGETEYRERLVNIWDSRGYIINEPKGTEIEIEVEGNTDVAFDVIDAGGNFLLSLDDYGEDEAESGSFITEVQAPYFLFVRHFAERPEQVQITSSHNLTPYDDVDDGLELSLDEVLAGSLDYPGDIDYFTIELAEGETIEIVVDSIMIDAYLSVDYEGALVEEVVSDDDSGGGFFGYNAKVSYQAPQDGRFFIVVEDASGQEFGGYFIRVRHGAE